MNDAIFLCVDLVIGVGLIVGGYVISRNDRLKNKKHKTAIISCVTLGIISSISAVIQLLYVIK